MPRYSSIGRARLVPCQGTDPGHSGLNIHLWIDGHHLIHWATGGATDLDNLVLLCPPRPGCRLRLRRCPIQERSGCITRHAPAIRLVPARPTVEVTPNRVHQTCAHTRLSSECPNTTVPLLHRRLSVMTPWLTRQEKPRALPEDTRESTGCQISRALLSRFVYGRTRSEHCLHGGAGVQ